MHTILHGLAANVTSRRSGAMARGARYVALVVSGAAIACGSSQGGSNPDGGGAPLLPLLPGDGGAGGQTDAKLDAATLDARSDSSSPPAEASAPDARGDTGPARPDAAPDAGVDSGGGGASCCCSGITQCSGNEVEVCGDDMTWGSPMACANGLQCISFSGGFASEGVCGTRCTKVVTSTLSLAITDDNLSTFGIINFSIVGGGGGAGGTAGGGGGGGSSDVIEQNTSLSPYEACGGPGGAAVGSGMVVAGGPGATLQGSIAPNPGETVLVYVGGGGGGGASESVAAAGGGGSGYFGGAGGGSPGGGEGGGSVATPEPQGGWAGGSTLAMAGGLGAGTRGGSGGDAANGGAAGMSGGGGGGGGYGGGGGGGGGADGGIAGSGGSAGANGDGTGGGLGTSNWSGASAQAGAAGQHAGQGGNAGVVVLTYVSTTGSCPL